MLVMINVQRPTTQSLGGGKDAQDFIEERLRVVEIVTSYLARRVFINDRNNENEEWVVVYAKECEEILTS
jgi:hypothetical protein